MKPRQPVPDTVRRLAAHQATAVTREQALGLGLTGPALRRLLDTGLWPVLVPGVYSVATGVPSWETWAWTAVLAGGHGARLTGLGAAFLHGLVDAGPDELVVLIPVSRGPLRPHDRVRPDRPVGWTYRRECAGVREPRPIRSPPCVTVEDTVLDLVEAADGPKEVTHWVTAAVQRRLTTPRRLRAAADRRRLLRHRRLLGELLTEVAEGAETPLELRYLRDVERAHGLPRARRQVHRRVHGLSSWADALYDEYGVLVELDGRLGHEGAARFRDMDRDNAATDDGLVSLRYGWSQVADAPCEVASRVARQLRRRGWTGPFLPCPRCRAAGLPDGV